MTNKRTVLGLIISCSPLYMHARSWTLRLQVLSGLQIGARLPVSAGVDGSADTNQASLFNILTRVGAIQVLSFNNIRILPMYTTRN